MSDSPFISEFRDLLSRHAIKSPHFAHGLKEFANRVLYAGPVFDEAEIVAGVQALVEGKWAVAGEYCHRFEHAFSKYVKQKESVFVNSGSSADLLMVAAAKKRFGWADGDKIIVSPVGFPTTISAITLNGLTPVFADIEWETLNFDLHKVAKELEYYEASPFTSPVAILVSPVLGNPPDMDQLTDLSNRYGCKILLDGCDSLGSTWRGQHLNEYATASTCSFYPAHHISTMQGGMISSNDPALISIARSLSTWGRSCWCVGMANTLPCGTCGQRFSNWLTQVPDVTIDHRYTYAHQGYNLQGLDIQAAIGLAQMDKVDSFHAARRANYAKLGKIFENVGGIQAVKVYPQADPSWFGFPVICDTHEIKKHLVEKLEGALIQTRSYFAGNLLLHEGYKHLDNWESYPNATEALRRIFFLGVGPHLTPLHIGHIESVVQSLQK